VRLFVGVELGDPLLKSLDHVLTLLRRRAVDIAPKSRVTWVSSDRLHITVRFIGHVDESQLDAIKGALLRPLTVMPFEVAVTGIGAFPASGSPRVVWAAVQAGGLELQQIEREVSGRLQQLGISREEREYRPHITLARVREPAGLRTRQLLEGLTDQKWGNVLVEAATLFESRLSPKGPTYVPLQRTLLLQGRDLH
jgi:2'-5' RNA ligase